MSSFDLTNFSCMMLAITAPYIPISNPGGQKVFPELPADILWNQTKKFFN